jgi:hypothetical protein
MTIGQWQRSFCCHTKGVKAMRVKYEVYRDGDLLVAAAIVKLNRKEEKRLAELIETEGEITLCFLTTLTEVENPLIIRQEQEFPLEAPDYDRDEEHFMLSGLLAMVEEEVADLRDLLEFGEPTTKQKGVNDYERLHCELALAC